MTEKTLETKGYNPAAALLSSPAFLNAILNSTYYGIASYEPIRDSANIVIDFFIRFTNAEVPGNLGKKIEDVIHKKCSEVYPGIFENGIFEKMVSTLESGQPDTYEISVPVDGKTIWLTAAIEKVNDTVTVTSKNITFEKEAALRLEKMNDLLAKKEALLEQKNLRLQSQNDELASFNYIASHDLQEPLRKIRMFSSRIEEMEAGNLKETSLAHFKNLDKTAERMQHLIDDLLSYSSMDAENLTKESTDLNVILKDVLAATEDTFEQQHVNFKSDLLPKINGIPQLLHQLFLNVLMNAVKYRKKEVSPIIELRYERTQIGAELYHKISIADNGIGFDPQYKDKIFEVFQRLHGKKEYSGTGVGLAICKKIMHYHNGFITADGIPDNGAVFVILFPIA